LVFKSLETLQADNFLGRGVNGDVILSDLQGLKGVERIVADGDQFKDEYFIFECGQNDLFLFY
jgi:hypothetical protein